MLEDIANPNQRAKVEAYDESLYVVLRMFAYRNGEIEDQQVSFVLRNNVLLTFRETDFGIFKKTIGDKLISGAGNLRKKGEDYLLYSVPIVIPQSSRGNRAHCRYLRSEVRHEIPTVVCYFPIMMHNSALDEPVRRLAPNE